MGAIRDRVKREMPRMSRSRFHNDFAAFYLKEIGWLSPARHYKLRKRSAKVQRVVFKPKARFISLASFKQKYLSAPFRYDSAKSIAVFKAKPRKVNLCDLLK